MKMKTILFSTFFTILIVLIHSCNNKVSDKSSLQKVLTKIEQIKSATYFSTISGSAPGDTSKFATYDRNMVEFFNPADTFIGSTFAWFQPIDTSKLYFYYDGLAKCYIDDDIKTIEIDSFKTNTLPFRPITPPFFNYIKSIIKYTLETNDSISTSWRHFGDTLLFSLSIYNDKQVEFFGHPFYIDDPYETGKQISRYDIWINKSNNLPFQYRREMSTNTSWETIKKLSFNNMSIDDFTPSKYFPNDYAIAISGKAKPTIINLLGKNAPNWSLLDINNNLISLNDLKSKVIIIQFTGIGCGPCHASIPFLKQLVNDYKFKSLELVSIESWSKDIDGIKRYYTNNNLNYKFLISNEKVLKDYQVRGVPVFYILDEKRIIRNIINGYAKESTDKQIIDSVTDLI